LNAELSDHVGVIQADRDRLRQVLQNLLANSIKFTPQGGSVKISSTRVDGVVEVKVEDSGRGIEPEFLPYIFTPFSQADYSATRSYGGLGLGLAICKELVELHGGTIEARSEGVGTGATFVVRLPADPSDESEGQGNGQADEPTFDANVLEGTRILLVEDDVHTMDAIARALKLYGAQVTPVGNADQAIAAFQASPPDIIVSDIGLPQQDGFELMRRIRALEVERQMPTKPAIALSAFAGEKHRREAVEAGFQGYVPKPARTSSLLSMLVRHLPAATTDSA
jgi:CheY-like chemotaxis protein